MPQLRQDPTTRDWVVIATERAKRPHDFQKEVAPSELGAHDPKCPFCPGNEGMTPPEEFAIRHEGGDSSEWRVRVIPNKFAALQPRDDLGRRVSGLFRQAPGYGNHEVIIETPRHDRPIPLMERGHVEDLIRAYRARYLALREDERLELILIFKNHGRAAGTSLEHPHSQLIATPVVPADIRVCFEIAA